jgi:predicted molibdopterin-dependent oxidoreductase YjgC
LVDIAERVRPGEAGLINLASTQEIREDIARAVPFYEGIQRMSRKGNYVQWGGERLCEGWRFNTEDGKARFLPVAPPEINIP